MRASRRWLDVTLGPGERRVAAAVIVVGIVLRFVTTSPLWLDEALSVNVARLDPDQILDALRRDGHPPLYYLLLHGWMAVFGESDAAVRALSGVLGVVGLGLLAVLGYRRAGPAGAWAVAGMAALTPWWVRYATETRMYAMVAALATAGWLIGEDLLREGTAIAGRRRTRLRWIGLALVTGAALLSHYWTFYLGAGAVAVLAWIAREPGRRAGVIRVLTALAGGALLFLPWLPAFAHQATHTGTPWARATRPTRALLDLVGGLGGGERYAEQVLFGFGFLVLVAIGLFATRSSRGLLLEPRTEPLLRPEMALAAVTLGIGLFAGFVTDATFTNRYAAVFIPFLTLAAGIGLLRLPGAARAVVAVGLAALAAVGLVANVLQPRSQGEEIADAIAAEAGPDDVVLICPDQLGPATLRSLPDGVDALGLPALERPELVDWTDYAQRNEAADPDAAVAAALDRAGAAPVWLVFRPGYRTYGTYCEDVLSGLETARPGVQLRVADRAGNVWEPAALYRFPPG